MKKLLFILLYISRPCIASWAKQTLKNLSLDQKIGQLFVVAARADSTIYNQDNSISTHHIPKNILRMQKENVDELISRYHVGGIVYMGKHTSKEQLELTQRFQKQTHIPLLIAQDLEWGLNMRLTDCAPFPRAMTLGAIQDTQLIYDVGREIGRQCRALGVHLNCAPVVDINNNPNNPIIGIRSFGDDTENVIEKAQAFATGLQHEGILSCIKHFPGHGDTTVDSHSSLPRITHTKERLDALELVPFKQLIQHGIPAVMIAHLAVPALDATNTPASLSHSIITKLLRETYTFDGLIITDGLDMHGLTSIIPSPHSELQALLAGNDILLSPVDVPGAIKLIKQALCDGTLTQKELDQHVLRILKAKEWIFITQKHPNMPSLDAYKTLHTEKTHKLKVTLYEHAITCIGKNNTVLLSPNTSYAVMCLGNGDTSYFTNTLTQSTSHTITLIKENASQIHNSHIICALYPTSGYKQTMPPETDTLIEQLIKNNNQLIFILFGSPYLISQLPQTTLIIVAYEQDKDAQKAAAKVLFGELPTRGQLPITLR